MAEHTACLDFLDPVLDATGDFPHLPLHLVHWEPVKTVNFYNRFDYQFSLFAQVKGLRRASNIVHLVPLLEIQYLQRGVDIN